MCVRLLACASRVCVSLCVGDGHVNIEKAVVLSKLAPLYECLFVTGEANNGVLPTLKLVQAIQKQHLQASVTQLYDREPVQNWAPHVGGAIRMVTKGYRNLVDDDEKYATCMKKVFITLFTIYY